MIKIIATIGSNSASQKQITKIILSGAKTLLYRLCFGDRQQNIINIKKAQNIIYSLNSEANIMIELPSNRLKLGNFPDKRHAVNEGQELTLKCAEHSDSCDEFIPLKTDTLSDKLHNQQTVTVGDGAVSIQIVKVLNETTAKIKILNNGHIRPNRPFNCNWFIPEDDLLKTYQEIKPELKSIRPSYIVAPYINYNFSQSVKQLRLNEQPGTKMIAQIDREISLENIEELCQDSNYSHIFLDRASLGVTSPYEKSTIYQKELLKLANKYKKPVIIGAHLLPSTMKNLIPSRADIADLTNIVLEGAAGIALTYTTAEGARPAYSITVAKKIIEQALEYKNKLA